VRYVGVSNFSGWHLMKTIGVLELMKLVRPVSQLIHYTLQALEVEYELVPILIDQGLGILIWSPLAGGLLSGKYRRGHKPPD
jgi:aryl-alcohol dehydrogenase-like predicted oxidoreductase